MRSEKQNGEWDPERAAHITVEPYPHDVRITANGEDIAHTRNGVLFRDGYAPDIYVPAGDVRRDLLRPSGLTTQNPFKDGIATWHSAEIGGTVIDDIAWSYDSSATWPELAGLFAFDFAKVRIEVDGQLVRGHVRDPHKVITVTDLGARLVLELKGKVVADTTRALELRESGLPARYYVPAEDINHAFLEPSDRQTVCTYKGEATYWHLVAGGERFENAVWAYDRPWTDFATDIGRIGGHLGFYASVFDKVLLDGRESDGAAADKVADRSMIASPTVDAVMRDKVSSAV